MKKFILISVIMLTGCAIFKESVPVVPNFPDPVPDLMKKCEELMIIEGESVAITEMLKTVVNNYKLYYQCSNRVDGWQNWYQVQKKIFDEIKP